jgi:transposase-like protein
MLGIDASGITIISDRDKELQKAISEVLSEAYHSYCYQHFASNIQISYGLACRNLFWSIVKAYIEVEFEKAMEKIKEEKEAIY